MADRATVTVDRHARAAALQPDRTASGKERFEVLDGLRGSAAFLIVLFHLLTYSFGFTSPMSAVPRAYLAVDFFFALSGFVVAYAYDTRWERMTIAGFFKIRLIRLHPLVILGATLGLASYLLDPFGKVRQHAAVPTVLLAYLTSLLLLPSPAVAGRPGETQALNGPSWSLMQEYLGNIAYALFLRRLRPSYLGAIVLVSGLMLLWQADQRGSLDAGWGYENFWMAPLRLTVSFVLGLWLYRTREHFPRFRLGLVPLSLVLVMAFAIPGLPQAGGHALNGLFDALCVLLVFPAIILSGAHSEAGAGMMRFCKFSGRLSYPLYITHIGFVYVLSNYAWTRRPSHAFLFLLIGLTLPLVVGVAWLALRYFDEPIRARLSAARTT